MPTLSALVDAYIDVNIVLMFVCLLWIALSLGLRGLGLAHTVTAQLKLLRAGFCVALASPVLMALYALAEKAGAVAPVPSVNLSDFVVSQYLQGRFDVSPATLESTLGMRSQLTELVLSPLGGVGLALVVVLFAGFAWFAGRFVASLIKLRGVIGESFLWRRFGRLELRLSDTVLVPFSTRTLTRRIVVFPSSMLGQEEDLKIALGHELQHLRQHDVEWEIGLELLRPVFFWNPFFYLWKRQVEMYRELSCDRQVLTRHRFDVAAYCECLIRVCHSSLRRRQLFAWRVPAVGLVHADRWFNGHRSAALLRRRMISLIDGRAERHPNGIFALLLVPLVTVTALAVLSIQKPGDWSEDRIMLSTIVNLERLAKINNAPSFGSPGF